MTPKSKWYHIVDLLERAGATFAEAFAAALTVGTFTDLPALRLAAVAAGFATVKFLGIKASLYLKSN